MCGRTGWPQGPGKWWCLKGPLECLLPYLLTSLLPTFSQSCFLRFERKSRVKSRVWRPRCWWCPAFTGGKRTLWLRPRLGGTPMLLETTGCQSGQGWAEKLRSSPQEWHAMWWSGSLARKTSISPHLLKQRFACWLYTYMHVCVHGIIYVPTYLPTCHLSIIYLLSL